MDMSGRVWPYLREDEALTYEHRRQVNVPVRLVAQVGDLTEDLVGRSGDEDTLRKLDHDTPPLVPQQGTRSTKPGPWMDWKSIASWRAREGCEGELLE